MAIYTTGPSDHAPLNGVGVLTKWWPDDLAYKTSTEADLVKMGHDPVTADRLALAMLYLEGVKPIETLVSHNALVNTGLTDYNTGLTTAGLAAPYTNAAAALGVGDNNPSVAFAVSQSNLQGTNTFRKAMDATYPSIALGVLTFRSTYATTEAVFTWAEWGCFNNVTGGRMLNRAIAALGTKPNTQSWQLSSTLTLS